MQTSQNVHKYLIQIMDKNGNITKKIDSFSDSYGQPLCLMKPCLLRTRSSNELIVCEQRSIQCFNPSGVLQWYYAGLDLRTDKMLLLTQKIICIFVMSNQIPFTKYQLVILREHAEAE